MRYILGNVPPLSDFISVAVKGENVCHVYLCRFAATVENLGVLCAFLLMNEDEQIIQCILEALECVLKAGMGQMVKGAIEGVGGTSGFILFCTSVDV